MVAGDVFKYVDQFPEHLDNALEKVQGDHLNIIQTAVQYLQSDNISAQNRAFLDNCLFILDNNQYINYMFYMDLTTQDDIFKTRSSGYTYNKNEGCVYASNPPTPGIVHSTMYNPSHGKYINAFILKADALIPRGAGILYSISKDLNNYYPLQNNDNGIPVNLNVVFDKVYIKAELVPNTAGESPRIFAISLFCLDRTISPDALLPNPSLEPIDSPLEISGDTTLIYGTNGALQSVTTGDGAEIVMHYNLEGQLDGIKKIQGTKTVDTELIRDETNRIIIARNTITIA